MTAADEGGGDGSAAAAQSASSGDENGIKPFADVVPDDAVADDGFITTHRADQDLYFEIPDSLLGREVLMVSRVAQAQRNLAYGGEKVNTQVLRWERRGDDLLLRQVTHEKTAEKDEPVYQAVQNSTFEPILKSFSIAALNRDSTGVVIEATELFTSDVPALGLPQGAREQYRVRRLDGDRTYLEGVESFPKNTDVEVVLTYDAQNPPSSQQTGTISVAMNHSMVLLPTDPMQPRLCDDRVGYFSVEQINFSTEKQKAAETCFITRWRLEPSDPEAYADGELVEPKDPIVYYVDPATPEKWRPYIRRGIEAWQEAFREAGFENAIIAKNPPTAEEDSTFDPDDVRFSTVRYFASEVQNAYGPHVHDPRSGEILESDIGMYHNVLNLLRNWYFVQTAAVNPAARAPTFDTDVMGRLLQFVVAHEVGHTLGLPHNWASSNAVPVDSLRSPSYTSSHGTAPSIMDYARFNYVAQPGDDVESFLPQIGVYDRWSIEWGYRAMPGAETPDEEAQQLDEMILENAGDPRYLYGRQTFGPVDPRSQSEDLGRDAMRASELGIENLKRIVPNLVDWTAQDGENYDTLDELYGAVVGQWQRYLGHVTRHVGGVHETFKTYQQEGPVYEAVPADRQRRAVAFVAEQAFETPEWLIEPDVLRRIEATGTLHRISDAQESALKMLLAPERLARMIDVEATGAVDDPYTMAEMMGDVRTAVWAELDGGDAIGPYRRSLQRSHLDQLASLMNTEVERNYPEGIEEYLIVTPVKVSRSDIRARVRAELETLRDAAETARARTSDEPTRVHLNDVLARIDDILNPENDA
jgi:hypothetical protein